MNRAVVWAPDPLYLSRVVRAEDGTIKRGFVINGIWDFEVCGNECLCLDDGVIVNRWEKPTILKDIPIGSEFGYDYNAAIDWAKKEASW
jgi:hypothetical protein